MSEKTKRKNGKFRWYRRKWVVFGLLIVGGIVGFLLFSEPITIPDYPTKTSLDPEYLPTAQYLLEHPEPDSSFIRLETPLSYYTASYYDICIVMYVPPDAYFFSEVYLNNEPASFSNSSGFGCGAITNGTLVSTCRCHMVSSYSNSDERLAQGLHLLEIRVKYSRYGEPVHIHRWAFEVE